MQVLYSPFIVPVCAFALALGIVAIVTLNRYHVRKLQSEERMAAIARGLPLPPEPLPDGGAYEVDPFRRAANARKSGIILVGVGLGIITGLAVIAVLTQERMVMAGSIGGIIPFFIGVGMLVDYRLQLRDLQEAAPGAKRETHQSQ